MVNMCLNSTVKGFAPMGLGLFSHSKGYKGFAPMELIKVLIQKQSLLDETYATEPIQKQSQRDEIFVEKRTNKQSTSSVGAAQMK